MSASSKSSSSRPVHSAYRPTFPPPIGNVEYSTWAHLTCYSSSCGLPNLVTACGSTITVFAVEESSHKLQIIARCDVAENVVTLQTLTCSPYRDQLMIGFAGSPRLSVVSLRKNKQKAGFILEASSVLDLTRYSSEEGGATSTQDIYCVVSSSPDNIISTGMAIVDGGAALVAFDILRGELTNTKNSKVCYMGEPYILPLRTLSNHFSLSNNTTGATTATQQHHFTKTANISSGVLLSEAKPILDPLLHSVNKSISTGWGDILDLCFLEGYSTPTVAILHGNTICSGRMAGAASNRNNYLAITAISVTTSQKRSVILWHCTTIPIDTTTIHYCEGALIAMSPNVICYLDCSMGKLKAALALNGFAHVSCSFDLQPNPSPLPRLAIQLDASRFHVLSSKSKEEENKFGIIGILVLRNGRMYGLQYHITTHSYSTMDYYYYYDLKQQHHTNVTATDSFLLALIPLQYKLPPGVQCLSACQLMHRHQHHTSATKADHTKNKGTEDEVTLLTTLFDSPTKSSSRRATDNESTKNIELQLLQAFGAGYMFVGSSLGGHSQLLAYGFKALSLENHPSVPDTEQEPQNQMITPENNSSTSETTGTYTKKRKLAGDEQQMDRDTYMYMDGKVKAEIAAKQDDQHQNIIVAEGMLSQGASYTDSGGGDDNDANFVSEDELETEEAKLYDGAWFPTVSSDESIVAKSISPGRKFVSSITSFVFHLLDSCAGLGPLGYGCNGPAYTSTTAFTREMTSLGNILSRSNSNSNSPALIPFNDNALSIFPYGYGECGGIAIIQSGFGAGLTCSTTDIRQEVDVVGVCGGFVITNLVNKLVVLPRKSGGALLLQELLRHPKADSHDQHVLEQVDLQSWCLDNNILWDRCFIRSAFEVGAFSMALVIEQQQHQQNANTVVVLGLDNTSSPRAIITNSFSLSSSHGRLIAVAVANSEVEKSIAVFTCVYENGHGIVYTLKCASDSPPSLVDFEEEQIKPLGEDPIVAMDAFASHGSIFVSTNQKEHSCCKNDFIEKAVDSDDDDAYIYRNASDEKRSRNVKRVLTSLSSVIRNQVNENSSRFGSDESDRCNIYIACCRASGKIEIYRHGNLAEPLWESYGAGSGCPTFYHVDDELSSSKQASRVCHEIVEMRFFFAGPTQVLSSASPSRPFCLALHTVKGDFHLYSLVSHSCDSQQVEFSRVALSVATRQSSEEGRHRAKLFRRGMLFKEGSVEFEKDQTSLFCYNSLNRFIDISGRSGLFSATARPFWVLADRGMPVVLQHRMRHLAAGSPNPIKAFCANLWHNSFLTVHERIGRVGSQRLTIFNGLSSISSPDVFLPGGGTCVTKIPLGVTVRRIAFIEDTTVSSLTNPLFLMVISRDFDAAQSHLNDDGLTPEERKKLRAEKDAEKTRRQVEADLAGVDHIEQEWVEEIERDDYFEVKIHLGGAPPIPKSTFEVWLVNGNGWKILDRYELENYNKALTLLIAPLTEVADEPKRTLNDEVKSNPTIFAVGIGYVDQDGEDVTSKGKVILFEVHTSSLSGGYEDGTPILGLSGSINVVYEKEMLMGPVTSLSCLTCNNTTRLVVGAGAEVTIEQWNGEKLTQVGFFHAQMHVLDVKIFRNFFLLSDAYDSLYFLVWRESDKSLTLLAKDYEPTIVYCTGLLSRGASIAFVCHDERENLQFFQYAPKDDASRGGNKLVCRADFHLGTQIVCLQSHWCKSSLLSSSATTSSSVTALRQQDAVSHLSDDDQRFALHFGTIDGSFGGIIPISEQTYWRLAAVRSVMSNAINSHCALSTRAWRLYRRCTSRGGCQSNERMKGVLDGDILLQFLDLPRLQQEELTSAVGSTVDLIMDNLVLLECSSILN
eukprot:CAMPEP_0172423000 /NCGR_PEP_ID=MMETSP1064-20121228/9083_1 /TAXON_ID=202472 /ORGANISM="Aulacoseira subarctica , Strain CCAP 1002/5" /LENGTH=1845 /DNA_ID=CAMNT_0013164115 /DNA_START=41 /DNA_END=5578 /DNA_ORIENTATION=+